MARWFFLATVVVLAAGATAASAQTPPPNTLTLTVSGPSTATSGQDVTYHLHVSYAVQAFDTGLNVVVPCHTTLLSERLVSGRPPTIEGRDGDRIYWFGSFSYDTEAEFEINLHIATDFAGTIHLSAYVPPGFGGEGQSNVLDTVVMGPGAPSPEGCPPVVPPAPGPDDPTCGLLTDPTETAMAGHLATNHGTVTIPELHLTQLITSTGCYQFRHLQLPRSPMLVGVDVESEGYRPLRWSNYVVLYAGGGVYFSPPIRPGSLPDILDVCPGLLSHPQTQSAAEQLHASLCAQLLSEPSSANPSALLPQAGMGPSGGGNRLSMAALVTAVVGFAVAAAALSASRTQRPRL